MTEQTPRIDRPRTSRARFRKFVEDYRARRVDEPIEGGGDQKPGALPRPARRRQYLREYVRWLKPHAWGVGLLFLLALAIAGLQMIEPLFMRYIVDRVLLATGLDSAERLLRLNTAGALFLLLIIVSNLLDALKGYRQR